MVSFDTALAVLRGLEPLTSVLSVLAAIFAGIAAWSSYKLASSIRRELKSDEILIPGVLHNPDLRNHDHANAVIQTTIFNKSRRKAYISAVLAFDEKGQSIDVTWSDGINQYGNPTNRSKLIGINDSSMLCIRRSDGTAFCSARIQIAHSFSPTPLEIYYQMGPGWQAFFAT